MIKLSVIICAHNPRHGPLTAALGALRVQDLGVETGWELILIDNASTPPLSDWVDLSWHPQARIVEESRLGLTHARLRSFHEAQGELLVYVDDDNVLEPDYLRLTCSAIEADPQLGAIGGRVIASYEALPPPWFEDLGLDLACRDLGDQTLIAAWDDPAAKRSYPVCAPIGAGMALRKSAFAAYVSAAERDPRRQTLGRRGADLASGEDNDMVMTLLGLGWRVGYIPELRLTHLIPRSRLTARYLARYAYSSNRTWVQVLGIHGIVPWPPAAAWTLALRKARAFIKLRAWSGQTGFIRWRGACGIVDGRGLLTLMDGR